jgi:hypothetical protein
VREKASDLLGVPERPPSSEPAPATRRDARPALRRETSKQSRPLRELLQGTPRQREEAERHFLWHPEAAEEMLERVDESSASEEARASLRYLRAALEERTERHDRTPRLVHAPPVEGLVLIVERLEGRVPEELAALRHTARAEGLPLTCVVLGERDGWGFARQHAGVLGGVDLYVDADERLAQRWNVARPPAVVGLRKGGRPAFVHMGRIGRARLARAVAALVRPAD